MRHQDSMSSQKIQTKGHRLQENLLITFSQCLWGHDLARQYSDKNGNINTRKTMQSNAGCQRAVNFNWMPISCDIGVRCVLVSFFVYLYSMQNKNVTWTIFSKSSPFISTSQSTDMRHWTKMTLKWSKFVMKWLTLEAQSCFIRKVNLKSSEKHWGVRK